MALEAAETHYGIDIPPALRSCGTSGRITVTVHPLRSKPKLRQLLRTLTDRARSVQYRVPATVIKNGLVDYGAVASEVWRQLSLGQRAHFWRVGVQGRGHVPRIMEGIPFTPPMGTASRWLGAAFRVVIRPYEPHMTTVGLRPVAPTDDTLNTTDGYVGDHPYPRATFEAMGHEGFRVTIERHGFYVSATLHGDETVLRVSQRRTSAGRDHERFEIDLATPEGRRKAVLCLQAIVVEWFEGLAPR